MQEVSKYTVFNIREYLNGNNEELGEDDLRQVLSEFSCEKNPDVERFAKEQSIEFAKKQHQSSRSFRTGKGKGTMYRVY